MSFVSDTVLSGGARLHIAREAQHGKDGTKRPGQSQGGRFDPLFRLVRDPFGVLGGGSHVDSPPPTENVEERKQLLQLRMREVSRTKVTGVVFCPCL